MALPHDATGLSAVCDCGISDHTHLLFLYLLNPFMSNVFAHPYQMDVLISNFRVVGWYLLFLFKL